MLKEKFKSVRMRLFLTLCITLIIIIAFLIIVNNVVLERFYLYSKQKTLLKAYEVINNYYMNQSEDVDIELELERIHISNNFDIMIKSENDINIYTTNRNFLATIKEQSIGNMKDNKENILYNKENINIRKSSDTKNGLNFILLSARLDNGYLLYIRVPIASIYEGVEISNNFLLLIGSITILISGIIVSIISKRFTEPISDICKIADKMSKLDFSHKYMETDTDDEINKLGKSINIMSDKLERTITRLRQSNIELERDIEEKSKIDEMRKQFISDVSHELKTPIALIQGYAEGLVENVNTDDESRTFYAEVILDESNKMDILVKKLLELMKLEYGQREFNNGRFNITELINEVIRKSKVMLDENRIIIEYDNQEEIYVMADEFYIEQIVSNYFTNAIKNAKEVNNIKQIKIQTQIKKSKVRISVYNTGENIKEEDLTRIWNRFYKVDTSRNRENGGTGIGLSLVKAIMNNYKNEYGVINKENGVEFYFELDLEN